MALHTELEIYKTTRDLLRVITKAVANMRGDFKRDLGGELRRECVRATVLIFRTNTARDSKRRYRYLMRLLERMEVVKLLLRSGHDMGSSVITDKAHAAAIPLVESIEKQANAWKKLYAPVL